MRPTIQYSLQKAIRNGGRVWVNHHGDIICKQLAAIQLKLVPCNFVGAKIEQIHIVILALPLGTKTDEPIPKHFVTGEINHLSAVEKWIDMWGRHWEFLHLHLHPPMFTYRTMS